MTDKIDPFIDICMNCPYKDCRYKDERDCEHYVNKAYVLISDGFIPNKSIFDGEPEKYAKMIIDAYKNPRKKKEQIYNQKRYLKRKKEKENIC